MRRSGKVLFYALSALGAAFFAVSWLDVGDPARLTACACFCMLAAIWSWVDSKVDL